MEGARGQIGDQRPRSGPDPPASARFPCISCTFGLRGSVLPSPAANQDGLEQRAGLRDTRRFAVSRVPACQNRCEPRPLNRGTGVLTGTYAPGSPAKKRTLNPLIMPTDDSIQVHWHEHAVSREDRERLNGHAGCVVWFTGLSGAEKARWPIYWTTGSTRSECGALCSTATTSATV